MVDACLDHSLPPATYEASLSILPQCVKTVDSGSYTVGSYAFVTREFLYTVADGLHDGCIVKVCQLENSRSAIALELRMMNGDEENNLKELEGSVVTHATMWVSRLVLFQMGCVSVPSPCSSLDRSFSVAVSISVVPPPAMKIATKVAVAPVGFPLSSNSMRTSPYTNPPVPTIPLLLQVGHLIVAHDGPSLYIYEVATINGESDTSNRGDLAIFRSTSSTQYNLSLPDNIKGSPSYARRLPPLSEMLGILRDKPVILPPHPDTHRWVKTWEAALSPANKTNATIRDYIWHVCGSDEKHHVSTALRSAADISGRRFVECNGLAANAFLHDHTVNTGGWGDRRKGLEAVVDKALLHAPSVLLIQNLDSEFATGRLNGSGPNIEDESRFWSLLITKLACSGVCTYEKVPPVLVVLATTAPLEPGPLLENLVYGSHSATLPDDAYIEYLWNQTRETPKLGSRVPATVFVDEFLVMLRGREAHEIQTIIESFYIEKATRPSCDEAILRELCAEHDESRRRSGDTGRIPSVRWGDIGGLEHVRKEIFDTIELPLQYPTLFGAGTSGILLYGPPGVGKTLVAKAVATECKLPFVSVKGPELLGSYVGESEERVRQTFQNARKLAEKSTPPACVLFFDEIDSLAPRRGGNASGGNVMDRVVSTLLTELDDTSTDAMVFFMGATNRPDLLDPSLLRPGRIDRLIYLGISRSDYCSILQSKMRGLSLESGKEIAEVASEVASSLPPNLTGADLASIVTNASMNAIQRLCDEVDADVCHKKSNGLQKWTADDTMDEWENAALEPIVTFDDLTEAAARVVPSVSAEEMKKYQLLSTKFSSR